MTFQRTTENFTCGRCGHRVAGNGYTNHCPKCLWSKHVDIDPGDRQATCGGLMEPVGLEIRGSEAVILHRCAVCGHEKPNKVSREDDADAIIALSVKR